MASLISWICNAVLSFGLQYATFILVDSFVKTRLKDAINEQEKRNIWFSESAVLLFASLLFYIFYQLPYLLILLACLTLVHTQLFGRYDLTSFIANIRAHWENHMQHEESMKQVERQKQHQQQLQQQTLGIAGLNHTTAAELGTLSGQNAQTGYQLLARQSHLHYPPNATVVPGQERPAYSLTPGAVTFQDPINKNQVFYPSMGRNWNNAGQFSAANSHPVGLMHWQHENNSNPQHFRENNDRRFLWSNMNLERRSLHSPVNSNSVKTPVNQVSSIRTKVMNVIRFGNTAPQPVGLLNNGQNMCFINSVIQCLARGPYLAEYLTADAAKELECSVAESELLSSLAELLDILTIEPANSDHKVFSAERFRKAASMLNPILVSPPGENLAQQDAAEFLMWLLATLHSILNKNSQALECDPSMLARDDKFSSPRLSNLKLIYGDLNANCIRELKDQCRREIAAANGLENDSYSEAIQRLSDLEWLTHKQSNDTIVDNLFTGQMIEAYYSLEHGNISVNLQAFNVLPVPIPVSRFSGGRLFLLEDCFKTFCNIENLTVDPPESAQKEPMISISGIQRRKLLGAANLEATPVSRKTSRLGTADLPSPIHQFIQPSPHQTTSAVQQNYPLSPSVRPLGLNANSYLDNTFKTSTPIEGSTSSSLPKMQRRCLLRQLPECLVIQLMRFKFDPAENVSSKIDTSINIRLREFSLKDVIFDTVTHQTDLTSAHDGFTYELYGMCLHLGDDSNGHYISYCQIGTKWYRMDDQVVTEVNMDYQLNSEEIRQNAYLLFYRRVNSRTI